MHFERDTPADHGSAAATSGRRVAAALGLERPVVFFDLEATGLDTLNDRIVEIACVRVGSDGVVSRLESRVDPQIDIPADATAVHGISAADLADAPTFAAIAPRVELFLADADLAGYNHGRYDLPLLECEFARVGMDFDWRSRRIIDVSVIFRRMEPRSLAGALRFYCGKELTSAHAATADVEATMEVLVGQFERYPDLPRDVEGLDEFTRPRETPPTT
jgi:DNA polymerase-3 subunit epsilon